MNIAVAEAGAFDLDEDLASVGARRWHILDDQTLAVRV
jgi:hypothetical protein